MSGDSGIGGGKVPGEIRANRDAYAAGRDLAVTNNYLTAADMTAGFRARVVRAADELAVAVAEQWRREERLRRIQDPVPIRVRWTAADPLLSDHVANIGIGRAVDEANGFDSARYETVAAFAAIPSRRLVVIGPPGAGKTVFTLRFTLDLLARRQPGDPVPVILGLHSWDPAGQSLHEWMAQRLATGYPALRTGGKSGRTIAGELVRGQLVIPVLDGLDEVGQSLRGEALRALNMSLDRDAPVIVTCRAADYRQIVAESDVLTSAAVIELLPLELGDLADYLPRTARKVSSVTVPGFATKWDPVLDRLRNNPDDPASRVLLDVLRTPLMTSLARSIYSDTAADPAELLDGGFAGRDEVEAHLLDGFIPAAFAARPGRRQPPADDPERWLSFLARHLDRLGTRDLEWWRLEAALPTPARWLAPGLITWLTIGTMLGIISGHAQAWLYGALVAAGVTAGLAVVAATAPPASPGQRAWWRLLLRRLCYLAAAALPAGVIVAFTVTSTNLLPIGGTQVQVFGIGSSLLAGFAAGIVLGTAGIDVQQAPATTPLRLPRRLRALSRQLPYGVGRGLLNGIVIAAGLWLAWGAGYAATQALRITATPLFPPGGGAVARLADGGSYVDYPNGLRYIVSSTADKFIVTARAMKFYTGTADGKPDGSFFTTEADCRAYDQGCLAQPAAILHFAVGEYGGTLVNATVLSRADDFSPYFVDPVPGTGLNVPVSSWLTAPHLSDIPTAIYAMGTVVLVLVLPVSLMGGLLLWLFFPSDITQAISPGPTLQTDRRAAIFRGLALTLLSFAAIAASGRIPHVLSLFPFPLLPAQAVTLSIAMGLLAITLSTWLRFQVARAWLAVSGRLPWRLMSFLEEAHSRGALRQAAAAYQFRHVRLQERLATRAKTPERELLTNADTHHGCRADRPSKPPRPDQPASQGLDQLLRGLLPLRVAIPSMAHQRAPRPVGHAEV